MKTIMIVNDEPNLIEEIKSYLESDDINVITANNNREALEQMEKSKEEKLSLILIETFMPGSYEPALFSVKPSSRMDVDAHKIEDFLQKPFSKKQLIDFVKSRI